MSRCPGPTVLLDKPQRHLDADVAAVLQQAVDDVYGGATRHRQRYRTAKGRVCTKGNQRPHRGDTASQHRDTQRREDLTDDDVAWRRTATIAPAVVAVAVATACSGASATTPSITVCAVRASTADVDVKGGLLRAIQQHPRQARRVDAHGDRVVQQRPAVRSAVGVAQLHVADSDEGREEWPRSESGCMRG